MYSIDVLRSFKVRVSLKNFNFLFKRYCKTLYCLIFINNSTCMYIYIKCFIHPVPVTKQVFEQGHFFNPGTSFLNILEAECNRPIVSVMVNWIFRKVNNIFDCLKFVLTHFSNRKHLHSDN